ncbi:MAG: thioredoxin domain-containing protein [Nitrospirota bacterium]|nr:thioredoxin domain-containing protein [Nitrospirota bacterium]
MRTQESRPFANRLISEKSPYLLQHAYNPVDWHPWGEEAFEKARAEDKPIFLSIGYSTCHWCHVMERESFEDAEVAALMNDAFVSIKVDREERPDIDGVYMTACQLITGRGGWPLTIIMTHDKKPFFAGTYIPKESRFGYTGMMELVPRIMELWHNDRNKITVSGDRVADALRHEAEQSAARELGIPTLNAAAAQLEMRFDQEHGGFDDAPKFPNPSHLLFLLRHWKRTGREGSLLMVEKTLRAFRSGGIYDHLGFGIHRYSTDARWLVPHFEKMLYDQAFVAMAFIEAWQATGNAAYGNTAREIFTYVMRDMTSPEGAFFSGEDADSEGIEGKFYLWTADELRAILGAEDSAVAMEVWNVAEDGNFADEVSHQKTGGNILHLTRSLESLAKKMGLSQNQLSEHIETIREKLLAAREKRIRPGLDDKVLTDWNGLMIAALAKGAQALDAPEYAMVAQKAADFILTTLRRPDGRLLHRYRDGEAAITAHLTDYAFFVWGLIDLYEATFETQYLKAARDLTRDMLTHFRDSENGGFYFTPDDGEELLVRKKEIFDGALPSGNSVAMLNLLRLARMTGDTDLEEKAAKTARAFSGDVARVPSGFTLFLSALDFVLGPTSEVVVAGDAGQDDTNAMLKALRRHFVPNKVVLMRPTHDESAIVDIAPFVREMRSVDGKATAYVCRNFSCAAPTTDARNVDALMTNLK